MADKTPHAQQFKVPSPLEQKALDKAAKVPEEVKEELRNDPSIKQFDKKAKGGMTASRRADGIAARGKTRGRMV
jgi:hypothetical protein